MRRSIFLAATLLALPALGTERTINFGEYPFDAAPSNFVNAVGGEGSPGTWKVILDDVPSAMPSPNPNARELTQHAVVAQLSGVPVNNHFPMLLLNDDTFGDFKFTTRFKIVGGGMAQMGGIVFRYQDEKNYYVFVASALDNRVWFFKVVNGQRGPLLGPKVEMPTGQWHELSVECEGNHIHCLLDGKEIMPMATDDSFASGKLGFWTKSDAVCYFTDAKITYTPRESLAQSMVHDTVTKYPRLVGLKIVARRAAGNEPVIVASKDEKQLGQPAESTERDVIDKGKSYYGKDKRAGTVTVTAPLRDRNGESIAAVVIVMKSFPGETQDTAVLRSQTILKAMEPRVSSLDDLLQ